MVNLFAFANMGIRMLAQPGPDKLNEVGYRKTHLRPQKKTVPKYGP